MDARLGSTAFTFCTALVALSIYADKAPPRNIAVREEESRVDEPLSDPVSPADPLLMPLDLSARQPDAKTLEELFALARRDGRVEVIATLPIRFTPEGLLSGQEKETQRAAIARAQDAVLAQLPPEALLRQYDLVPQLALRLDIAELGRLIERRLVSDVARNELYRAHLFDSTRITHSLEATAKGSDGRGMAVAIVDTGVLTSHGFLGGRVVAEACFSGRGAGRSSLCPNGSSTMTGPGAAAPCTFHGDCRHGTHVAGISAGAGGSAWFHAWGQAFSGVAPAASIVAVNVFSRVVDPAPPDASLCAPDASPCLRPSIADVIAGLGFVARIPATVARVAAVNLSLGTDATFAADCPTAAEAMSISTLRSLGIATVASSGNGRSTTGVSAPACVPGAITVGATYKQLPIPIPNVVVVAGFSNSSPQVELLAPGTGVVSADASGPTLFTWMDGTSMAAPHVTGAWAAVRQRMPAVPVASVLTRLQSTGRPVLDFRNGVTRPLINVDAARLAPWDFDGDGSNDIVVYRPSTGEWWIQGTGRSIVFGNPNWSPFNAMPVPADYDGDGRVNMALYRRDTSAWHIAGQPIRSLGCRSCFPVPADYDGDGRSEPAVWDPSDGSWSVFGLPPTLLGMPGDRPAPSDYDGDGRADMAVWRPSTGQWLVAGRPPAAALRPPGLSGDDRPVPADYDGDGLADFATWRKSTGEWTIRSSQTGTIGTLPFPFGQNGGDRPTPRDINDDGRADLVVWRSGATEWLMLTMTMPGPVGGPVVMPPVRWGRHTDQPL